MKTREIVTTIQELAFDELSPREQELVTMARVAVKGSYAPYSHFNVGAAILLDNGEIVTGANQENAATPSSMCAERSAAYYAHARYPKARFKAIAIAARDTTGHEVEEPISPCGSCRQALLEYEKLAEDDVRVLLAGRNKVYVIESVKALVPLAFTDFD